MNKQQIKNWSLVVTNDNKHVIIEHPVHGTMALPTETSQWDDPAQELLVELVLDIVSFTDQKPKDPDDSWVKWDGASFKSLPDKSVVVEVERADGKIDQGEVGDWGWMHYWSDGQLNDYCIIRYRVLE